MQTNRDPHLSDLQRKALDLCLAVYRLTKLFPENEIISNQIKELANEITADVLLMGIDNDRVPANIDLRIERMLVYFQIAKEQNWVNPVNYEVLIKDYRWLKFYLKSHKEKEAEKQFYLPQAVSTTLVERRVQQRPLGFQENFPKNISQPQARAEKPRTAPTKELNSRQKKILDFLKKKNEAKMADLQGIFKNEVTERTLRNDLRDLSEQKMIKAEGEFKTRKYYIK
jgi:hypothetical protein